MSNEPLKMIPVPKVEHPISALDGISMIAIDTDPDAGLIGCLNGLAFLPGSTRRPLGVLPVLFHGTTPGYLVITYDPADDPGAKKDGQQ